MASETVMLLVRKSIFCPLPLRGWQLVVWSLYSPAKDIAITGLVACDTTQPYS